MKYEITNTTIKAPRIDPKTKKDARSVLERVGHAVSLRENESTRPIPLYQNRRTIVPTVTEAMLRLKNGGMISIKPIEDITTALKDHTIGGDSRRLGQEVRNEIMNSGHSEDVAIKKASVVEMGKDTYSDSKSMDNSDAVNPSGEPNFVVKASNSKRMRKNQKGDSTEA